MLKLKKVSFGIFLLINLFYPLQGLGEMTSTNYTIYADSIGWSGVYGTSTSYELFETTGESPVGFTTSTTYEVRGGYQAMEKKSLTITISNGSLDLGNLTVTIIGSATTTVTITTDSENGYVLSVGSISGSSIDGVSDGAVTIGSEEYGVAVSGTDAAFADDRAVADGLILASYLSPATLRSTTLTFKGAISAATQVGSREQNIVLNASANF